MLSGLKPSILRERTNGSKGELTRLQESREQQSQEVANLRKELETALARIEKYKSSEGKQKQEIERAMIEFEKIREKMDRNQSELMNIQKEREALMNEVKALKLALAESKATIDKLMAQQKTAQTTPTPAAAAEMQKLMAEITRVKQLQTKTEQELQKTLTEKNRLAIDVERLKQDL